MRLINMTDEQLKAACKSNRINITIDSASLAQLDKQAAREGRSRSAQIRELVKKEAKKIDQSGK